MTRDEWIVVGIASAILVAAGVFMTVAHARTAQRILASSCMNNQKIISSAIFSAAMESNWTNGTPIVIGNVTDFLREGILPQCHGGGQYVIGKVGEWPTCTLHGAPKEEKPSQ